MLLLRDDDDNDDDNNNINNDNEYRLPAEKTLSCALRKGGLKGKLKVLLSCELAFPQPFEANVTMFP